MIRRLYQRITDYEYFLLVAMILHLITSNLVMVKVLISSILFIISRKMHQILQSW